MKEEWWIKRLHTRTPRGLNVASVRHITENFFTNQNRRRWRRTDPRVAGSQRLPIVRTPPPQAHHAHIEDRGVLRSQARERTRRRAQLMEQINNAADGAGPLNQPSSVNDPGGDPGEALNGGEDQNHLVQSREQNGSGIGAAEAPQIDLLIALEH